MVTSMRTSDLRRLIFFFHLRFFLQISMIHLKNQNHGKPWIIYIDCDSISVSVMIKYDTFYLYTLAFITNTNLTDLLSSGMQIQNFYI